MKVLLVVLSAFAPQFASAQLTCSRESTLPQGPGDVIISASRGAQLKFKYNGVGSEFNAPNFIVVIPSSGTTPSFVRIGLNYPVVAQLQPGGIYGLGVRFTTVDVTPADTAGCPVTLMVPKEPPPSITSVVNGASLQPFLSPGASVAILGTHLTGP